MKKFILSAALVAATVLFANAQESVNNNTIYKHISPIEITCMQFNTQAMRDSAVNNEAYIAALNALQKQLNTEKVNIENAMKNLKLEKSLYDNEMSLCKDRKKQLETMQKNLMNDIKKFDGFLKDIKKQYDLVKKMDDVSCDAIKGQSRRLADLEDRYEDDKRHTQNLLDRISKHAADEISSSFAMLNDFLIEITDKETRLKNIQAQNKTNIDIVKAAIKAANGK